MAAENFKVKRGLEVGTGTTITSGGVDITGIITAVQFKGDGSGLTGVVGSGSGVIIKDEGSTVGTAGTINFVGSGIAAAISEGTATVTVSGISTANVVTDTLNVSGVSTFTGKVAISTFATGGELADTHLLVKGGITFSEYTDSAEGHLPAITQFSETGQQDLAIGTRSSGGDLLFFTGNVNSGTATFGTNLNTLRLRIRHDGETTFSNTVGISTNFSVGGISTLSKEVGIGSALNVVGVSTFNEGLFIPDTKFLRIGNSVSDPDFLIAHDANSNTVIENKVGALFFKGTGSSGNIIHIQAKNNVSSAIFNPNAAAKLYFAGNEKLTTTGTGIEVPDLSVTGVGTIGRVDVNGLVFGTNATTFAAKFPNDAVINVGTGNDLQISHVNDVSLIRDTRAGAGATLAIGADKLFLRNKDGNENYLEATDNGSVKLFYDFAPKFETDTGGVKITGVCTATSFSGDGSALTGVTASGTGIIVRHDGSVVGTASSINFSTNLDVTPIHAGIVTVTASSGSIPGISTTGTSVFNEIVVGSAVTVNSGGIIATGVGITADTLRSNGQLVVGTAIYGTSRILLSGGDGGQTDYYSGGTSYSEHVFRLMQSGSSITRFRINQHGVDVSGIATATTFSGSGASLTSLPAEELTGTIEGGRFPTTLPAVSGESLTNLTGASSGTYGSSSLIPMITVDSNGRITGIATTSVSSGGGATDKIEEGDSSVEVIDSGTGQVDVITDNAYVARFGQENGNRTYMIIGNGVAVSNDYGTNTGNVIIVSNTTTRTATLRVFTTGVGMADDTVTGIIDFAAQQAGSGGQTVSKIESSLRGGVENKSDLIFSTSNGGSPAEAFRISHHGGAKVVGVMTATSFVGNLSDAVTSRWTVGNNGASDYSFTGPGGLSSTNDPKLYLARGQTYEFVITNGATHPFQIQQSNGTAYNTGVTNNGVNTNGVVVKFEVPFSAPNTLQYKCTSHGSMGNTIIVYPDLSP